MISVRYQDQTFAPSAVRRYLPRVRLATTERLHWPDVARLALGKRRKLSFDQAPYLMSVLSPQFSLTKHGLFFFGMPPHGVVSQSYAREHGRFYSEGINNHVHLSGFASSSLAQFEIGVRAIRQWILAVTGLRRPPGRTSIYLTGKGELDLCIYTEASQNDLAVLDSRLGGNIVVQDASAFLRWAFPAA